MPASYGPGESWKPWFRGLRPQFRLRFWEKTSTSFIIYLIGSLFWPEFHYNTRNLELWKSKKIFSSFNLSIKHFSMTSPASVTSELDFIFIFYFNLEKGILNYEMVFPLCLSSNVILWWLINLGQESITAESFNIFYLIK